MREKRPGYWELRVFAGADPLTGRKQYRTRTFRGTKRQAQSALAVLITEVDGGVAQPKKMTVDELLQAWLEHIEHLGRSRSTLVGYRRIWSTPAGAPRPPRVLCGTLHGSTGALFRRLLVDERVGRRPQAAAYNTRAPADTASRMWRLKSPGVRRSTSLPSSSASSSSRPASCRRPGTRPGSNSTRRSMSLSGRSSPRAQSRRGQAGGRRLSDRTPRGRRRRRRSRVPAPSRQCCSQGPGSHES